MPSLILQIKAVPGSSRDALAGMLGDRLKIRIAAPPEEGKANAAVCGLVAEALGVRPRQVQVVAGRSAPEKTVRIAEWPGDAASAARLLRAEEAALRLEE